MTEDEIRRITKLAIEVAKASAIAKKTDIMLGRDAAYQLYWTTSLVKDPAAMSATDKQRGIQAAVDAAIKHKDVVSATASVNSARSGGTSRRARARTSSRRLMTSPSFAVTAKRGDNTRSRSLELPAAPAAGRWSKKTG